MAAALPRDLRRGLEIQIHPANRCRRVRTVALGRPLLTVLALLGVGYGLFVAGALALAPGVARGLAGSQDYPAWAAERLRHGERLRELIRQLDELARRGDGAALDLRKIELAYGLPAPPLAAGGRPIDADPVREGERRRIQVVGQLAQIDRMLADLEGYERAHPDRLRETPAASPIRGRDVVLVSPFARLRNPFTHEIAFHVGLDLAAPAGTPARAPAAGRVAFAGHFTPASRWWRLGNLVILVHGDRFATVFGHCAGLAVKAGQAVRQGQVVATVGASGWATGPQLHYEVWRRGDDGVVGPVDPRLYILDRRWPGEEQLLLAGAPGPRPGDYDPLPVALGRR